MSSVSTDGWDMIVSATQGALNDVLDQCFDAHPIKFDREFEVGSTKMNIGVDCTVGPIQLNAMQQGLTLMNVEFPIETGTLTYPVRNSQSLDGMSVVLEMALTYVESELQPTGDGTNYDFLLDFTNPDAFQKVSLKNIPEWLQGDPVMVAMVELSMVYALEQWAANNPKVTVCTVTLGAASSEYPALVPSQAFYSFNLNEDDPDQTPLSVLILTVSTSEGQFNTGTNYIPSACNSSLLISEGVLLSGILLPAVAQAFATSTSNFTVSGSTLSLKSPVNVTENGTSLEITSFSLNVANDALNMSMAGTHDFFMGIGMDITASASLTFKVGEPDNGEQTISMVVSGEPEVKVKPELPWWLEWASWILMLFAPFIGIFVYLAMLIFEGVIVALGVAANQKMSSSFVGYSLKQVVWANTQWLEIESIDLPGGVQVGANLTPDLTASAATASSACSSFLRRSPLPVELHAELSHPENAAIVQLTFGANRMTTLSRRDLFAAAGLVMAAGATACKRTEGGGAGTQSLRLECSWINKELAGKAVKLRAFNGSVPGPTIRTRPGQLLHITVKNSLPPYDSTGWPGNHNVPHALDSTNLHLHGLDIAPHLFEPPGTGNPLAQMIRIPPGRSFDYTFEIPADHPPGLYWYHPHLHGATAVQAVSGMAGGLLIEGDIDEVPEIKAARDIPLAIQDLGLFPGPTDADPWCYDFEQNAIWQTFTGNVTKYNPKTQKQESTNLKSGFSTGDYPLRLFLLNGEPFFQEVHNAATPQSPTGTQLTPTRIPMAPGEVVRFRMLNACSDNLMPIVVEQHEMHLLALDGVNFPEVRVLPVYSRDTGEGQVQLAPANRAEFLIKANATPGTYRTLQLAQTQQFLASDAKVIAEIVVAGPAKDMALPTKLPVQKRYFPVDPNPRISNVRNIQFSGTFPPVVNPYVGIDFTINNNSYDERAVPQVVARDSTEIWNVEVFGQHHGGTEGHPFHIHVNHFEPLTLTDNTDPAKPKVTNYPPGTFLDTVWVPASSVVTVRMRFKQWTGKAVYHCHILPHEDTGMMQNFLIV